MSNPFLCLPTDRAANYCVHQSGNGPYILYIARSILGDGWKVAAITDKTGKKWLEPGYLQAAKLVEHLARGGYFLKGYDASKWPAMQNKWANNESDFILNTTALPGEVAPLASPGFETRIFPIPAVDGHGVPKVNISADGIGVLKESKHINTAKQLAAFMASKNIQQKIGADMNEIPIMKGAPVPPESRGLKERNWSGVSGRLIGRVICGR